MISGLSLSFLLLTFPLSVEGCWVGSLCFPSNFWNLIPTYNPSNSLISTTISSKFWKAFLTEYRWTLKFQLTFESSQQSIKPWSISNWNIKLEMGIRWSLSCSGRKHVSWVCIKIHTYNRERLTCRRV